MTDRLVKRPVDDAPTIVTSGSERFRLRQITASVLTPLVGLALALAVWQGASAWAGEFTVPPPVTVFDTLGDNFFGSSYLEGIGLSRGGYVPHVLYTVRNVFVGVGIGALLGITLGLLSNPIRGIGDVVNTVAVPVVVSPIVVAAPFFLIWFGVVAYAQILIVAFYSTFLLYIYSRRAGYNVRPHYVEFARTLGKSPLSIFREVYVPATVPEIAGALRIALAGAWGLEAIAELLGAQQGVGFLIQFYSGAFQIDAMIALVILLGAVALAFDKLVVVIIRLATRWAETGRKLSL